MGNGHPPILFPKGISYKANTHEPDGINGWARFLAGCAAVETDSRVPGLKDRGGGRARPASEAAGRGECDGRDRTQIHRRRRAARGGSVAGFGPWRFPPGTPFRGEGGESVSTASLRRGPGEGPATRGTDCAGSPNGISRNPRRRVAMRKGGDGPGDRPLPGQGNRDIAAVWTVFPKEAGRTLTIATSRYGTPRHRTGRHRVRTSRGQLSEPGASGGEGGLSRGRAVLAAEAVTPRRIGALDNRRPRPAKRFSGGWMLCSE